MNVSYTILSSDGLYRSQHPEVPEGRVAHLYHHKSFAEDQIAHTDDPSRWVVKGVDNLEAWLEKLLQDGFTHVYEQSVDCHSTVREIRSWLASILAWRVGRNLHGNSSK
jgi:hypothetical protein